MVFVLILLSFFSCQQNTLLQKTAKIGVNQWMGYHPLLVADKSGIFKTNNADTELVNFTSANDEIEAFKQGNINGAALTLDEAFSLIADGYLLKIVLVLDYSAGGDQIIGQPEITEISQLTGKKVGYEGSLVGDFLLSQALEKNHIKKTSIEMVNVSSNEWIEAFKSKKVDALVCFNPIAAQLVHDEKGTVLFSSALIPFQIIDVLVFSNSYYEANKENLVKIVKSWFDALAYQKNNPAKTMELITTLKNIDTINYKESLNGLGAPNFEENKRLFDPNSPQNIYKYAQSIMNFMLKQNLISDRFATDQLFPSDILEGAEKIILKKE